MDDGTRRQQDYLSPEKPNVARIYDYFLGGGAHFAADRAAAAQLKAATPDIADMMRANRAFLRRAVTFLVEQGISQFLDIGSGIPTVGNVHEIAQELNPAARVVYVDHDPVAVTYSRQVLQDNPNAGALLADARDPEAILAHPELRRLLDLRQPVGLLLVALLHFIGNEAEAAHTVATLRDAVAPGSYLVISHSTYDGGPPEVVARGQGIYAQTTNAAHPRSRDQIARFFAGLDLVPPGLVYAPLWRPESPEDRFLAQPERSLNLAGVGRTSE